MKKVIVILLNIFFYFFDFLLKVIFKFSKSKKEVNNGKKEVLIVRLDAIGDAVLWLDSAKAYREIYPREQYNLTLLCNISWSDLAKELSQFDGIITFNKKKFINNIGYRIRLLKSINNRKFQIVVHPTYSREFMTGDSIVRISNAESKIGYNGDYSVIMPFFKKISDKWYTKLISASNKSKMELEINTDFVNGISNHKFSSSLPKWPKTKMEVPIEFENYFVVFPGASTHKKLWPIGSYASIAKKLNRHTGWGIILCGGPNEVHLANEFLTHFDEEEILKVINLIGKTNLLELAEVIRNADFLIANDTSGIHISAAVSTPSVCILGGGHFGRFLPYSTQDSEENDIYFPKTVSKKMPCFNCNWQCKHPRNIPKSAWPCIEKISEKDVWNKVLTVISKDIK